MQADCRNATPFSMTLKEVNVMDNLLTQMTESAAAAIPKSGSAIGYATVQGTVIANKLAADLVKSSLRQQNTDSSTAESKER